MSEREKIIAFDDWYAQFYLSKDFVRVIHTSDHMRMIAMKRHGRLIAYMKIAEGEKGRIVYVYPTAATLAASYRNDGKDEHAIYAEDGVQVFGGERW